jgi:hypothetical protein
MRLVHYTSAEAAVNILRKKEMWMRNAITMNDFMEVEHEFECLRQAYGGAAGALFKNVLESSFPNSAAELERRFNEWLPSIRRDTYLTCISEHRESENAYGRLSMWRAYGSSTGVALVLNGDVFESKSDVLKAYTFPVAYFNRRKFSAEFLKVAEAMKAEASYLQELGKERVFGLAFNSLRSLVVCTKHLGFQEEMEWRVIHSPEMHPSNVLSHDIQTLAGIPQRIVKIPLQDIPEEGLIGLELPKLLDRIIIGPTQLPQAISQAFHRLLCEAGVPNPEKKIFVSEIPLR